MERRIPYLERSDTAKRQVDKFLFLNRKKRPIRVLASKTGLTIYQTVDRLDYLLFCKREKIHEVKTVPIAETNVTELMLSTLKDEYAQMRTRQTKSYTEKEIISEI